MSARTQFICRTIGSIKLFKNFSIRYFFPLHSISSTFLTSLACPLPLLCLCFQILPEESNPETHQYKSEGFSNLSKS